MIRSLLLALSLAVAPAWGATRPIALEPASPSVPRCQTLEFTIRANPQSGNPYDPAEIDLRLEVISPSGKTVSVPAFFYQPFEHARRPRGNRPTEWLYPTGKALWKARFAPTEAGRHRCTAVLTDRRGETRSPGAAFTCTPSESKGFVRVSRRDPRFLELDDGTPFFAVGQNVAFVYDSHDACAMIRKLGEHGANTARVWACCEDWAMAIEARKSAYGRSWAWKPPLAAAPGRPGYHRPALCVRLTGKAGASVSVQPTRPVAVRPATRYRLSGARLSDGGASFSIEVAQPRTSEAIPGARQWQRFEHVFTTGDDQWWLPSLSFKLASDGSVWLRDLSLTEADGGPELLPEADPSRPHLGVYHQADSFLLDRVVAAAEEAGVRLQIVLFTRDHYMPLLKDARSRDYARAIDLGKRLLRYAVARWGSSTHVLAWEYFNEMNPGLPTDRFYAELGRYLEQVDANRHLRATSAWAFPSRDHRHPQIDLADMHWYLRPSTGDLFGDAARAVAERSAALRKHAPDRPALFSEFGMTDDQWKRSAELDRDRGFVHLHNALWASALSGLSGTVMHWYWDDVHKRDLYGHYAPVSRFVADIPFTTAKLQTAQAACDRGLRVLGRQGPDHAYLWVQDPASTWKRAADGEKPGRVEGAAVTVGGLAGAFRVQWWDTWQGAPITVQTVRARDGAVRLAVPAFSRDVACRLTR